jgi:hypothetical protein
MELFADGGEDDVLAATPAASERTPIGAGGATATPASPAAAPATATPATPAAAPAAATDAGPAAAAASERAADASAVDVIPPATAATPPATATPPPTPATPTPSNELVITSVPKGAKVYLDGAPVGRTPVKMEASADRHRLAIIAPGYKPHTGEIDGGGTVAITLDEVTPTNGPAGIKVRCKQKNRYYVSVDGAPVGQVCPTERIGVELGEHTVEVYDPITDSRRAYTVKVKQTRRSVRVKVD